MDTNQLAELIGYFGLSLSIVSLLFKSDKIFKLFQAGCSLSFMFHFYLLGFEMGSLTFLLGFISITVGITLQNNKVNYFFAGVYVLLFIYSAITFTMVEWYELLPALNNLFWIYAMLFTKDQKTNIALLPVIFLWIIYALATGSNSQLINQVIFLTVLCYRMYIFNKPLKINHNQELVN